MISITTLLASVLTLVDPFVGTGGNGHCTPAATVPWGAIQAGPDTGNFDWQHCSGYRSDDRSVLGFSSTHLSGTGCVDLGDLRLVPFVGEVPSAPQPFLKESESASPGFYGVTLENDIRCEMTASERAGLFRFAYPEGVSRRLVVDFQDSVIAFAAPEYRVHACCTIPRERSISAELKVVCWARRHFFAEVSFSAPIVSCVKLPKRNEAERAPRYVVDFGVAAEGENTLLVATGISSVDEDGARAAASEVGDFDFARVKAAAEERWLDALDRFSIVADERTAGIFYTSLYHLLMGQRLLSDKDGRFRGGDDKLRRASGGAVYSELSLWDTYRAAFPFLTLAYPEVIPDFVNSMLDQGEAKGYLPVWPVRGNETDCMIGNPAVSAVAEAVVKGFTGFDTNRLAKAVADSMLKPRPRHRADLIESLGYEPFDVVRTESVSRTLEMSAQANAAARLARKLGDAENLPRYERMALSYTNLFDSSVGFFRGRDSRGAWREPFDPFALAHGDSPIGGDYTEANAWQYLWSVPHDTETLARLLGGRDAALAKLDRFFSLESPPSQTKLADVTGLIGQYAQGNEPSHHIAYLYALWGRPERTQELVAELTGEKFYSLAPDGICGNEDCGQMSAWYLFSVLGFYPVDPSSGEYVLGAPQLKEARLGKLTIKSVGEGKYVKEVTFRGETCGPTVSHAALAEGGELVFYRETKLERVKRLASAAALDAAIEGDYVKTGDIDAMWLRDSAAQLEPTLKRAQKDPAVLPRVERVLRRQFASIRLDPYANAFLNGSAPSVWAKDLTEMRPGVHERKWELDSLCYPLRLASEYHRAGGDARLFDADWIKTVDAILAVFREQQRKEGTKTSYRFQRITHVPTDTLANYGYGWPTKPCGLIASAFRPSDDATTYPFHVPSNFFAVDVLRRTAEILSSVNGDEARACDCLELADEVERALAREAVREHPKYGRVYAYEVDGFGNALFMDDANVPSLLALPLYSNVKETDPIYLNTRRLVWSEDNPYFFRGKAAEGIGSPHTGLNRIWPMSLIVKGLTATSPEERSEVVDVLLRTDAGTSLMHESFHKDDPTDFTRPWFAWANALLQSLL